jgi:hypothetical protein
MMNKNIASTVEVLHCLVTITEKDQMYSGSVWYILISARYGNLISLDFITFIPHG